MFILYFFFVFLLSFIFRLRRCDILLERIVGVLFGEFVMKNIVWKIEYYFNDSYDKFNF